MEGGMKPETIQIIIGKWNSSNDTTRNALMKFFLENNGNFNYQQDWLIFLAEAFGVPKKSPWDSYLNTSKQLPSPPADAQELPNSSTV
jgi:hypothetical protein